MDTCNTTKMEMYKQLWETNSYRVAARRKENLLDRDARKLLVLR